MLYFKIGAVVCDTKDVEQKVTVFCSVGSFIVSYARLIVSYARLNFWFTIYH